MSVEKPALTVNQKVLQDDGISSQKSAALGNLPIYLPRRGGGLVPTEANEFELVFE